MSCDKAGCDYTTPATCPTWDMLRWAMDNHVLTAHPELRMQGQGQGGGASSRQERLPRPTLDTGITEADWTFFESQWERYKRSTRLLGQDATDQLWACASDELSRLAHDAGATQDTSEADLITMFNLCSVQCFRGIRERFDEDYNLKIKKEMEGDENDSINIINIMMDIR